MFQRYSSGFFAPIAPTDRFQDESDVGFGHGGAQLSEGRRRRPPTDVGADGTLVAAAEIRDEIEMGEERMAVVMAERIDQLNVAGGDLIQKGVEI